MNTIENLQKQIDAIKHKEQQDKITKRLEEMTLVGTFWASHLLDRKIINKPKYHFKLWKITGKEYVESRSTYTNPFCYTGILISVNCNSKDDFNISITNFKDDFSSSVFKYKITEEEFNIVYKKFLPTVETFIDNIRINFKAQDYVCQGDYRDNKIAHSFLDNLNIEYIELSNEKLELSQHGITIIELLRWNHHPYLYNTRLYKLKDWDKILEKIIYTITDKYLPDHHDYERAKAIKIFLEKNR